MNRYAVIDATGTVVNVIVWDGEDAYDPGPELKVVPADDTAQPGGTWDGTTFTPPAAS